MNWLGWVILGALAFGILTSFHPHARRYYRHHYGRARSYASSRYRSYRRRYY